MAYKSKQQKSSTNDTGYIIFMKINGEDKSFNSRQVLKVERHKGNQGNGYVDTVIAISDIPKGTILGRYCGHQWTNRQYTKIVKGTKDEAYHNMYSVKTKFPKFNHNPSNEKQRILASRMESFHTKLFGNTDPILVIDPAAIGQGKGVPSDSPYILSKIIDCRMNLFNKDQTKQSQTSNVPNCILVGCTIKNWPHVFVQTVETISSGTHLCIKYNSDFCFDVETKMDFNKCCEINAMFESQSKGKQEIK